MKAENFELLQGIGPLHVLWRVPGNAEQRKGQITIRVYPLCYEEIVRKKSEMIDEWDFWLHYLQELDNNNQLHAALESPPLTLAPYASSASASQGCVALDTTHLPVGGYIIVLFATVGHGWSRFLTRTHFRVIADQKGKEKIYLIS